MSRKTTTHQPRKPAHDHDHNRDHTQDWECDCRDAECDAECDEWHHGAFEDWDGSDPDYICDDYDGMTAAEVEEEYLRQEEEEYLRQEEEEEYLRQKEEEREEW